MTSLPENTVRRLVLVRQMYLHGNRHVADVTEIGRVIAVQAIDYAIEMLLKTVVSHYGSPNDYSPPQNGYYTNINSLQNQRYSPKMDFYRLWDEVLAIFRDPSKGINVQLLPLRREIDLLHTMRNDIQHNGIVPADSEVRKFAAYAESFLNSTSLSAFGETIDEITLASLIENEEIKKLILEAETELDKGNYRESIIAATKAFEITTSQERRGRPYRKRLPRNIRSHVKKLADGIDTKKAFGEAARTISKDFRFRGDFERAGAQLKFDKPFDELGELLAIFQQEIETLQESLEVITLGGNLREYMRFRLLSPRILANIEGELLTALGQNWQPDKSAATEVLGFVFDTILRWQGLPLERHES
jgi:hypothetical protein